MSTVSQPGRVCEASVPGPRLSPTEKRESKRIKPSTSLFAGAIAGAMEAATTYPFEYAKTRSQLNRASINGSKSKGSLSIILQTIHRGGVGAMCTGCSALVVGIVFKAGVLFLCFDPIKNILADSDGKLSLGGGIFAGMVAGALESVIAVTPTERIKTALIDDSASSKQYRNGFHAFRTLLIERGVRDLYRGLLSTTMKQSATSAVRMGSYNALKDLLDRTNYIKNKTSPVVTFTMGATTGIVTVYATQPFDTIKTRTQAANGAKTMETIRDIVREGGTRAFWNGSTMRLGRLILSVGITPTVYERVIFILER